MKFLLWLFWLLYLGLMITIGVKTCSFVIVDKIDVVRAFEGTTPHPMYLDYTETYSALHRVVNSLRTQSFVCPYIYDDEDVHIQCFKENY